MTKVMYITTGLSISGPSLQAILLTAKMRDAGYETLLVAGTLSENDESMIYAARQYGVEPILVPALAHTFNPMQVLRSVRQLYRVIRQHKPDVVHTHQTTAGVIGRIAARLARVPVVVHSMHVHPFRGYYDRSTTLAFIITERIGALFSDSIITLSEKLRRELTETYHITSRNRMIVLPSGYDLSTFARTKRNKGEFRAAWQIPPDAPLAGIVGRLMPVKNHALFLEAAALVRKQIPDAHFVIVGDGELRQELEAQARATGISDCVHFTGWQEDVASIYSDLNVLVISSLNEGAPVPIIEALCAGCPVVATNVGGVADLLSGVPGEIVPSGDASALAAALMNTLKRPYSPEPARSTMLHRYGIERLIHDLDSLYRGLMARKKS